MTSTASDLARFAAAQDPVFEEVCAELAAGRKRSHWMWFIFPQLRTLGRSSTAQYYGIADRAEAEAYWQHPLLSARLAQCTGLVLAIRSKTANQIFGSPDDLKLCSCMTLFESVAPDQPIFGEVLDRYYAGIRDQATLTVLGQST